MTMTMSRPVPTGKPEAWTTIHRSTGSSPAVEELFGNEKAVFVTPEVATALLADSAEHFRNRSLRVTDVRKLANAMKEGRFSPKIGGRLLLNSGGYLVDGQHRLHAVVESGVGQWFKFVHDVDEVEITSVDTGIKRTFADFLRMQGETNATSLAALTACVMSWESGSCTPAQMFRGRGRYSYDNFEKLAVFRERREEFIEVVALASQVSNKLPVWNSVIALAIYLFSKIDRDDCEDFVHKLVSGVDLPQDSPIRLLREALTSREIKGMATEPWMHFALIVKAWNHYRTGTPLALLKFRSGGARPENFPVPK